MDKLPRFLEKYRGDRSKDCEPPLYISFPSDRKRINGPLSSEQKKSVLPGKTLRILQCRIDELGDLYVRLALPGKGSAEEVHVYYWIDCRWIDSVSF